MRVRAEHRAWLHACPQALAHQATSALAKIHGPSNIAPPTELVGGRGGGKRGTPAEHTGYGDTYSVGGLPAHSTRVGQPAWGLTHSGTGRKRRREESRASSTVMTSQATTG
ncbi:unnamed protein product, partial [Discosporangium mesarthrocarpum]